MAIFLTFLLGISNFAVHKAVLESRHPLLRQVPTVLRGFGGRVSLIVEFVLLVGALLLAAYGHSGWSWAYLGYSLINGISGWLIISRKM